MDTSIENVESYIATFPKETQKLLEQIRQTIRSVAPTDTEKICYGIPTFVLNGNLVNYAGYKNHIGFYPGAAGIEKFQEELSVYKGAKGSVQFPLDQQLPLKLVSEITKFRVVQNEQKPTTKGKKNS